MWLKIFNSHFIFTQARNTKEFIKNNMQLKWEKYLRVHFSILAGPFKRTRVGGGGGASSRSLSFAKIEQGLVWKYQISAN
jgi:hypothetical protein